MKRKFSIQKGFVYGVTAIAVLAVAVGLVVRFSSVSADIAADSNADAVSECYQSYTSWPYNVSNRCYETMAAACTRTERLATKTQATPTTEEKRVYGDKVQAWDVGINNGNRNAKFRLLINAKRTGTTGPVRFDFALQPTMTNWGGNSDRIYIIFGDGLGYKKTYNYIAKNTVWSSYINKEISTGSVNIMFRGKNEDGCIKSVLNISQALATPTPSPSPSVSPSPSPSPSSTPTPDPNLLSGLKGCYYNGKTFGSLQTNRNENLNFIWGSGPATTKTTADNFAVRWEGYIIPKYTEAYTFKLNYDDGARIWIGGNQYINDWNNGNTRSKTSPAISMQAGVAVPIKIEYFDNTGNAEAQLSWKSAQQAEQVIPASNLKHHKDYICAAGSQTSTPTPSPSPSRTPSVTTSSLASVVPIFSATLGTAASSDGKGVTFTGTINPIVTGSIPNTNYTFWWNCNSAKTTYSTIYAECGAPETVGVSPTTDMKANGRRFLNLNVNSKSATRNFSTAIRGNTALLLIERNGKTAVAKSVYNFTPALPSQTPVISVAPSVAPSPSIAPPTRTPVPALSVNPVVSIDTTKLRDGLKADYFKGTDLKDENLTTTKLEKNINFNWGGVAPATGVPASGFSTRFTSKVLAPATGDYSIGFNHNDGVRVWLGGRLIIDQWKDWDATKCAADTSKCVLDAQVYKASAKVRLEQGKYYDLKVEHYDKNGRAVLKMFWKRPSSTTGEVVSQSVFFTPYNPNPPYGGGTGLMGSYYATANLTDLKMRRTDRVVNFNWGANGPATQWKDKFSARWEGFVQPRFTEKYTFIVQVNDGARLWIDGKQVINKWTDSATTATYTADVSLTAGKKYPIKLEMYENTGDAVVILRWKSASEKINDVPAAALFPIAVPTPSPTPSRTVSTIPSITPSRTASVVPSPSPSPSPSLSPVDHITKTFQPGFTGIYIPDAEKPQFTSALAEKGLSLYQYGPLVYDNSTPPRKTWLTAINVFNHKIGYYVKNPGTNAVTVDLRFDTQPEEAADMMVYKGWNLLANSSTTDKKLSDLVYEKRICTDESASAGCDGYSATVNFGNLSYGWKGQGKAAYTIIHELNDPRATDQTEEPFKDINVNYEGIDNVKISAGKLFWIYFFD